MNKLVYEKAISLLKDLEGLRLTPYLCSANKRTIGYGHKIKENETHLLRKITEKEADCLLRKDFDSFLTPIVKHFDSPFTRLHDCELCGLALFAFNCGLSRVTEKLSDMIGKYALQRSANSKEFIITRALLFNRLKQYIHYHDKNGNVCVSKGLERRRELEIDFFKGSPFVTR